MLQYTTVNYDNRNLHHFLMSKDFKISPAKEIKKGPTENIFRLSEFEFKFSNLISGESTVIVTVIVTNVIFFFFCNRN